MRQKELFLIESIILYGRSTLTHFNLHELTEYESETIKLCVTFLSCSLGVKYWSQAYRGSASDDTFCLISA